MASRAVQSAERERKRFALNGKASVRALPEPLQGNMSQRAFSKLTPDLKSWLNDVIVPALVREYQQHSTKRR